MNLTVSTQSIAFYQKIKIWCEQNKAEAITQYPVPLLGEGGTCSLFGELEKTPFQLESVLTKQQLKMLPQFQSIANWVKEHIQVDWFGIYLLNSDNNSSTLTKLSYFGAPSRAQFPVNEQFAQLSNNVSVALTGESRVINNVKSYVASGGEYYTCDPRVQSELCYPIISYKICNSEQQQGKILGIIDAECFSTECFDETKLAQFGAVCTLLADIIENSDNL